MIQLTRSLARQLRAVFRRLSGGCSGPAVSPVVELRAARDGLRARFRQAEAVAEFHQPGSFGSDVIRLPLDALADCEGRDDGPVTVQRLDDGRVELRWESKNLP